MPRETRSSKAAKVQAIVEPIASFYALLATFPYFSADDILTPPAKGWSEAEIANFKKLGKTDLVVEVMTHLSYIRTDHNRHWRLAYDDTMPINYIPDAWRSTGAKLRDLQGEVDQEFLWHNGLEPYHNKLSENVIALTNGHQYGAWLLLDVDAATIREFVPLGGYYFGCPPEDNEAGLSWKYVPAKPVERFFNDWKKKFSSLEWLPVPDKDGGYRGRILSQKQMGMASKEPKVIRKIYRDHGWGSANFRREECRKALMEWDKAYGKKLLEEFDRLKKTNRSPPPPDPLDEISD